MSASNPAPLVTLEPQNTTAKSGDQLDEVREAWATERKMFWTMLVLTVICIALAITSTTRGWHIGWSVGLWTFAVVFLFASIGAQASVAALSSKKERLEDQLKLPKEDAYFQQLANINVTNLRDYYYLVKDQTKKSFYTVVGTGLFGFALIICGLVITFREGRIQAASENKAPSESKETPDSKPKETSDTKDSKTPSEAKTSSETQLMLGYISTGSGVITQFIAAVFFYLYNRTVRQLKDYHDSLLDVQKILFALKLVEDAEKAEKNLPRIDIMLHFLMDRAPAKSHTPGDEAATAARKHVTSAKTTVPPGDGKAQATQEHG